MKINLFDSFKYVVGNSFSFKNKREVKVFFIYKERYSISLSLMIKKLNFQKEEQYYIDEAKKIIDKMIKDESLERYAEEYIKEKKKKRLLAIFIPLVSACAIAGAGVGIYYALNQPVIEYNVTCNIDGVTISDSKAETGKDYKAILKVNKEKVDEYLALPSTLTSVTSGGKVVTDYTYVSHDFTADLIVPKESVKGNIAISASLEKLTSLCLTAQEDNSSIGYEITGSLSGIQIQTSTVDSIDEADWTDWNGNNIPLNKGEFRYIRNKVDTLSINDDNYLNFVMTGKVAASGNTLSMINYKNLTPYCLCSLFDSCASLTFAPALPSTSLEGANYCYDYMFFDCTSLVYAPALPAETLEIHCYNYMFNGCTSLVSASVLPAETLADYCYSGMFNDCTSLVLVPTLPATNLAENCYNNMFNGCASLASVPDELPATTLKYCCYYRMFKGCTSLTLAPKLPATTLAEGCYNSMFYGCTSLISAPELPATTLTNNCYYYMFDGCTSLKVNENGSGTKIFTCPDITGLVNPVNEMFDNTAGTFTGTPTTGNTYYWYN